MYTSDDWLENKIGSLRGIDVWVAQYASHTNYRRPAMWQYADDGKFPEVQVRFDLNISYKNFIGDSQGDRPEGKREHYHGPLSLPLRGYFKSGDRGRKVRDWRFFWYTVNSKFQYSSSEGNCLIAVSVTTNLSMLHH